MMTMTPERAPVGLEAWRSRFAFRPVQRLFFSRAQSCPRAPALICGDHFRDYEEIADRACALSTRLMDAGVSRDRVVAVMMESGWERIVAVLGVLAAGAGYVSIDPTSPEPERQKLLRDDNASLIVTQPWLEPALASHERRRVVCVEDAGLPPHESYAPRSRQNPGDLACLCHVARRDGGEQRLRIDHRAASDQVLDVNAFHDVDSSDSLFEVGALDALSPYDPLGPLAAGGCVVVPTKDELARPAQWLDLIQDYAPTIWSSTPELLRTLFSIAAPARESALVSLRLILVAGEELPEDLSRAAKQLVPQARIVAGPFTGEARPRRRDVGERSS